MLCRSSTLRLPLAKYINPKSYVKYAVLASRCMDEPETVMAFLLETCEAVRALVLGSKKNAQRTSQLVGEGSAASSSSSSSSRGVGGDDGGIDTVDIGSGAGGDEAITAHDLLPSADDGELLAGPKKNVLVGKVRDYVHVYLLTELARVKLGTAVEESKSLLQEVGDVLDAVVEMDPLLHGFYFHVKSEYHKMMGPADAFFKYTMLYLAVTPLEDIPVELQRVLAFDLGLSALISDKIYNFGELLGHDVLASLQGTPHEWMASLLRAFNAGDIAAYETLSAKHAIRMNAQPVLVVNRPFLKEKLAISTLVQMLFESPAENRTLSFAQIAEGTRMEINDVERIVMKALSVGLIKGHIDGVENTVSVSWIAPRVLDTDALVAMANSLAMWSAKVDSALSLVQRDAGELLA